MHELNLSGTFLTTEFFGELASYRHTTSLDLSSTNLRDDNLSALQDLQSLEVLVLSQTEISSRLAEFLPSLKKLKSLVLESTRIDQGLLWAMPFLPDLRFLNIANTQVNSVRGIARASELRHLDVRGNSIGDSEIESILNLQHLEFLNVCDTDFSERGIECLNKGSAAKVTWTPPTIASD
jgi:Leucine-rich repeat (LRR) protein